jgi:hypothetical protein
MKLENAIKKIQRRAKLVNRKVVIDQGDRKVHVAFEDANQEISFWVNSDGQISSPHLRRWNDHSDMMVDYHAGYFVDNISQALDSVAPLPPKFPVGSVVVFKDSKRNQRQKLAGIIAVVADAQPGSRGGNYKVEYPGSADRWQPWYSGSDFALI